MDRRVRFGLNNGLLLESNPGPFRADSVEKVIFG
jgi:hypothetical protein